MRLLRILVVLFVFVSIATVAYAGYVGFEYRFDYPNNQYDGRYNIYGKTFLQSNGTETASRTYDEYLSGPSTNFDKLVLRTRVYEDRNTCPTYIVADEQGHCVACNSTAWLEIAYTPPTNLEWYISSKHKLVDPDARNLLGNTPSAFFTKHDVDGNRGNSEFKGLAWGCNVPRDDPAD